MTNEELEAEHTALLAEHCALQAQHEAARRFRTMVTRTSRTCGKLLAHRGWSLQFFSGTGCHDGVADHPRVCTIEQRPLIEARKMCGMMHENHERTSSGTVQRGVSERPVNVRRTTAEGRSIRRMASREDTLPRSNAKPPHGSF